MLPPIVTYRQIEDKERAAMTKIKDIASKSFQAFDNVIGIDIGSRAAKAVLLSGENLYTALIPTGMYMQESAEELIERLLSEACLKREEIRHIVGTGYGRVALSFADIPSGVVSEISAHGMGTNFLNCHAKTIVDIGGQDSKAVKIDPETGKVLEFIMNDKCAAGTGRFLEKVANLLGREVEDIGEESLKADKELTISSQCVVFAESEVISLRAKGEKTENILAGIHYATAKRVCTLLKRIVIEPDIVFSGGVSNNVGMRSALEKLLGVKLVETKLDMSYAGALGAAIFAQKELEEKKEFLKENNPAADVSSIQDLIKESEALFLDKSDGRKRVGHICSYTPLELINASGARHTRLMKAGSSEEITVGEMLTTSVFCDFTKSCLGAFETGNPFTKALDQIYFFDTCNPMKKTVEVLNEKYVDTGIYLLPRCRSAENIRDFFRGEIENFKENLEQLTGNKVEEKYLQDQIHLYNEIRQTIRKISQLRKRNRPPIRGSEFLELVKAFYSVEPQRLLPALNDLYEKLKEEPDSEKPGIRLMMAGGMVTEGDRKILDIIEKDFHAQIVVEDHCTGLNPVYRDIPEDTDPITALSNGYLDSAPCARMVPLEDRILHSDALAEEYQVDAVIYKYLKFCPCYGLTRHSYLKHFQQKQIPVLEISNDYSEGDIGQIKTRIEAFIEVLREKKANH